jgi:transposase-like protein
MSISDFKDSIILDRQRGATYQAIADRFGCSRQCIEKLLDRWNAKDVLVPTKHDRARQALQLIIDGEEASLNKAARLHCVTEDMIRKIAKKDDVDLRGFLKRNQAKVLAHSLDGQQFTALKIVDGTCYKDDSYKVHVEATCMVCGTRKSFCVSNLKAGYTRTCSVSCGWRLRETDCLKA